MFDHLLCEVGLHTLHLLPPEAGGGGEELVDVLTALDVQQLQLLSGGHPSYGSATGRDDPVTPPKYPLNYTDVVTKARPQQAAILTLPEPVHHEELGRILEQFAHIEPVLQVVPEVVAKERSH